MSHTPSYPSSFSPHLLATFLLPFLTTSSIIILDRLPSQFWVLSVA